MHTFAEAALLPAQRVGAETRALAAHPDRLPPGFVLDPGFEEGFYRNANLPEQLARLYAAINPNRVDEDALEPLCVQAEGLVRGSALLDDSVQLFYRALGNAGLASGELHLRRPDEAHTESATSTPPGTPVLHALKRVWAFDWTFESVLARLDDTGSVALEARPVLLLAGQPGQPDAALAAELGAARAWRNALGLVRLA